MMSPAMRAIPKNYSGVLFRSTLEADWASNLDAMRMRWQYEPEGIIMSNGDYYRPDIYLPLLTTNVEVKGPHDERIGKPHQLAADTLHAPGCATGSPIAVRDNGSTSCACGYGPTCPWRLTIIARPATNGRMCVDPVGCPEHPHPEINIALCDECQSYSFTDITGSWWCRRCHLSGQVALYDPRDLAFHQIDHKAGQYKKRRTTTKSARR